MGMLRMPSKGKMTKVLAATRLWSRQCISPSHTERRESLAPYRKKSRMMAASLKRLKTVSHTPEQGIRIPALTLTTRPTVKRSNLERNPGMEKRIKDDEGTFPYLKRTACFLLRRRMLRATVQARKRGPSP